MLVNVKPKGEKYNFPRSEYSVDKNLARNSKSDTCSKMRDRELIGPIVCVCGTRWDGNSEGQWDLTAVGLSVAWPRL